MTVEQIEILALLLVTIGLFLWGRWRHDAVALFSLLVCVLLGLIPADLAFAGFGHPAVITVACVLVLSYGLQTTGAVNALSDFILPKSAGPMLGIAALTGLGAFLSAFMNNVGAMALLMPVAIQLAAKQSLPPGRILMPLAFATILGGMTTLIGTPPNLIVSSFRLQSGGSSFSMFDFSPVGLAVAGTGLLFITLIGWRLVPARERSDEAGFDTGTYLTEIRVPEKSKSIGKTLGEIESLLEESGGAQIVGMIRNELRIIAPNPRRMLQAGDMLVIEAEPESLESVLSTLDMKLEEAVAPEKPEKDTEQEPEEADEKENKPSGPIEFEIQELVAMPGCSLLGRTASQIELRTRYGLNLLAISRQGRRSITRLRSTPIQAGDVLLMQGASEALAAFASEFSCVPLASRAIQIPDKGRAILAGITMALAIAGAAFGLLPAAVAFACGALLFVLLRIVPARKVYDSIDWSVIVLLAALIPVATALVTTGAADLIAQALLEDIARGEPLFALVLILVVTMTLSDFMNNAATAAMMCPIAISAATQLNANPDAFLMAVAIGASCAFLTPIGHQNNTLILGPGGFRFGDYWRLGLPMEILVVLVSVPALLAFWPL